jgi:hypothetical protein
VTALVSREPCVDCGSRIAIDDDALGAGEVTCPSCGLWLTVQRVDAAFDGPLRGATSLALRAPSTPWLRIAADGTAVIVGHDRSAWEQRRVSLAVTAVGALVALFLDPWAAILIAVLGVVFSGLMTLDTSHLVTLEANGESLWMQRKGRTHWLRLEPDDEVSVEEDHGVVVARIGPHTIDLPFDRPPTVEERELLARVLRRMALLSPR